MFVIISFHSNVLIDPFDFRLIHQLCAYLHVSAPIDSKVCAFVSEKEIFFFIYVFIVTF